MYTYVLLYMINMHVYTVISMNQMFLCYVYVNCYLNIICIQWNLRTTDTLGAGTSSVVERLSASRRF